MAGYWHKSLTYVWKKKLSVEKKIANVVLISVTFAEAKTKTKSNAFSVNLTP